jgi:hypothetical protein
MIGSKVQLNAFIVRESKAAIRREKAHGSAFEYLKRQWLWIPDEYNIFSASCDLPFSA